MKDTIIPSIEKMIDKEEMHLQFCKENRKALKSSSFTVASETESREILRALKRLLKSYQTYVTNTFGHAKT